MPISWVKIKDSVSIKCCEWTGTLGHAGKS